MTDLDAMAWNNRDEFKLWNVSAEDFKDCFPSQTGTAGSRGNAEHRARRFLFPKQATVGSPVSALGFHSFGVQLPSVFKVQYLTKGKFIIF